MAYFKKQQQLWDTWKTNVGATNDTASISY